MSGQEEQSAGPGEQSHCPGSFSPCPLSCRAAILQGPWHATISNRKLAIPSHLATCSHAGSPQDCVRFPPLDINTNIVDEETGSEGLRNGPHITQPEGQRDGI